MTDLAQIADPKPAPLTHWPGTTATVLPALPCGPFAAPAARRVPGICVGRAATPHLPQTGGQDRAFDDILFYAMQAEHQLARITEFLEADAVAFALPDHMHQHLTSIGGICRALDRVLEDIRATARTRTARTELALPA